MTDQVLDILQLALLGVLYLFFARVLWTVWTEVRTAQSVQVASSNAGRVLQDSSPAIMHDADHLTAGKPIPVRMTVIEPASEFGVTYDIGHSLQIGRDVETGVKITGDGYVSGRHALITMIAGGVYLEDLGSRNGTFLNGERIAEQRALQTGDRVQVGYTVLEAG